MILLINIIINSLLLWNAWLSFNGAKGNANIMHFITWSLLILLLIDAVTNEGILDVKPNQLCYAISNLAETVLIFMCVYLSHWTWAIAWSFILGFSLQLQDREKKHAANH